MEDYKPNSHLSKKEPTEPVQEKKVEKVIQGKVKQKKRSGLQKIAGEVIQEDARNVKSYIFSEVLIPALKKTISDVIKNGIDMVLYGESRGSGKRSLPGSKVSYRSFYDDDRDRHSYRDRVSSRYDYDDVIFDSRGEAEEVLSSMYDILDRYKVVSVADLFDLVGLQCKYTDNKYGWMDLRGSEVVRTFDGGYSIRLPKAMSID